MVDIKNDTSGDVVNNTVIAEFFTNSVITGSQLERQQIVTQDIWRAVAQFPILKHIGLLKVVPLRILPTNTGHTFAP
jgi:hypothetical protein